MRLSRKSEYALLALIELARFYEMGYIKIMDICESKSIPKKYLQQIMLLLKGAGYVSTERGQAGGYKLKKAPDFITVAEVVRLIDGPIAAVDSVSQFFYEQTPIEQAPKLLVILKDIREYTVKKLERTSIKDLI